MATEDQFIEQPPRRTENLFLNFGPQHPSAHGTLHLIIELEGETLVSCQPHIGYLHCGFEKLGEHRTYNQFTVIADRMNYLSPICNDVGWSMACEKLFDIDITPRCAYIRVIVCELSRIADHLFALGMQAVDIGAFSWFLFGFQHREEIYDILERCCGQRMTTSYTRIGGLMRDMDETAVQLSLRLARRLPNTLKNMETLLNRNRIWIERTRGVGPVTPEEAVSWGFTGPMLRAAGVPFDIRKDEPYLVYDEFDFDIPVGEYGDVYDRYRVRMEEMRQCCRIIEQACKKMPDGPINSAGMTTSPWCGSKGKLTAQPPCLWQSGPYRPRRTAWGAARRPSDTPHRDPCYGSGPCRFGYPTPRRSSGLPEAPTPSRIATRFLRWSRLRP